MTPVEGNNAAEDPRGKVAYSLRPGNSILMFLKPFILDAILSSLLGVAHGMGRVLCFTYESVLFLMPVKITPRLTQCRPL